ncbi:hypothetical protein [Pseudonocardia sp. DLS-67]
MLAALRPEGARRWNSVHLHRNRLVTGLRQYSYLGALLGLTLALDDSSFLDGGTSP